MSNAIPSLSLRNNLGTDYFGFYEDCKDTVSVPNIRKLLSKGIRITNAVSNPVCSATRQESLQEDMVSEGVWAILLVVMSDQIH